MQSGVLQKRLIEAVYQKRFEVRVNFGTFFEMINQMESRCSINKHLLFFRNILSRKCHFGFQKKFGNGKLKKPKKLLKGLRKRLEDVFGLAGR